MKKRILGLALAVFTALSGVPAEAASFRNPRQSSNIATSLGIRYDSPTDRLNVGQKANAVVVNHSKLAARNLAVKNDDKVELTLTGERSFTLLHVKSGRSLKFTFDTKGNVTPQG